MDIDSLTHLLAAIRSETSVKTFLLPLTILLAIDYAAKYSLKTWIAVKNLEDAPEPQSEEELRREEKLQRRRKIMAGLAMLLFFAAEVAIISLGSKQLVEGFFASLVAFILVSGVLASLAAAV